MSDKFQPIQRTPEESERERILFALLRTLPREYEHRAEFEQILNFSPFWKHYTDIADYYLDFITLIDDGFIIQARDFAYKPNGTWQDRFPPTPYRLTMKGKFVVENRGAWVFSGDTGEQTA